MGKKLRRPEKFLDSNFSQILKECSNHSLKRSHFYFISGKKKTEKRINSLEASKLLIERSFLKNIRICLSTNTSYVYYLDNIYGPLNSKELRMIVIKILEKVGEKDLVKPFFIDQLLKEVKSNTDVAVMGAIWLFNLNQDNS